MFATTFFDASYQAVLKPILFQLDPELVHDTYTHFGSWLGKASLGRSLTQKLFAYHHPNLKQTITGVEFANPVGLSAGFDYNAQLTQILPSVGFGFQSVGTVTYSPYEGNTKPRLGRLPQSKSLLVNKGFKSQGISQVLKQSVFEKPVYPIGISIGATNSEATATTATQIEDIVRCFDYLKRHPKAEKFAYYELNISCPNVRGSGHLASPKPLETVLKELAQLKLKRPLWVKFPIEQSWQESQVLIKIMIEHGVSAVVIGNLAKKRTNPVLAQSELEKFKDKPGNFSGKPTWELSNTLIKKTYQHFGKDITIVGVGGIFSATDAYHKIKLGASLVQLITGMIFEGPQLIGKINRDLVKHLQADGYASISEVVGKGIKN